MIKKFFNKYSKNSFKEKSLIFARINIDVTGLPDEDEKASESGIDNPVKKQLEAEIKNLFKNSKNFSKSIDSISILLFSEGDRSSEVFKDRMRRLSDKFFITKKDDRYLNLRLDYGKVMIEEIVDSILNLNSANIEKSADFLSHITKPEELNSFYTDIDFKKENLFRTVSKFENISDKIDHFSKASYIFDNSTGFLFDFDREAILKNYIDNVDETGALEQSDILQKIFSFFDAFQPEVKKYFLSEDVVCKKTLENVFKLIYSGEKEKAMKVFSSYSEILLNFNLVVNSSKKLKDDKNFDYKHASVEDKLTYLYQKNEVSFSEFLQIFSESKNIFTGNADILDLRADEFNSCLLLNFEAKLDTKISPNYVMFKNDILNEHNQNRKKLVDNLSKIQIDISIKSQKLEEAKEKAKNISDPRVDKNDSIRILNKEIAGLEKNIRILGKSLLSTKKNLMFDQLKYNCISALSDVAKYERTFSLEKAKIVKNKIFETQDSDEFTKVTLDYGFEVSLYILELKSVEYAEKQMDIDINFLDILENGGELGGINIEGSEARREYSSFYNGEEKFNDLEKTKIVYEIKELYELREEMITLMIIENVEFRELLKKGKWSNLSDNEKLKISSKLSSLKSLISEFSKLNNRFSSTLFYYENQSKEIDGKSGYIDLDEMTISNEKTESNISLVDLAQDSYKEEEEYLLFSDMIDSYYDGEVPVIGLSENQEEKGTVISNKISNFPNELSRFETRVSSLSLSLASDLDEKNYDQLKTEGINLVMDLNAKIDDNNDLINYLKQLKFELDGKTSALDIDSYITQLTNQNLVYSSKIRIVSELFENKLPISVMSNNPPLSVSEYQYKMIEKELNFKSTTDKILSDSFNSFFVKYSKLDSFGQRIQYYFNLKTQGESGIYASVSAGGAPSELYDEGVDAYNDTLETVKSSRENLKYERERLIFERDRLIIDSEIYSQMPELLKTRQHILQKKIDSLDQTLNDPESPFSNEKIRLLERERDKLRTRASDYDYELTKSIAVSAVIIGVAVLVTTATAGVANFALSGALKLAGVAVEASGAAAVASTAVGLGATAFGSTMGSIAGMYLTDAVNLSNFERMGVIDNSWNNFGEDFLKNFVFQAGCLGSVKVLGKMSTISRLSSSGTSSFVRSSVSSFGKTGIKALDYFKPVAAPGHFIKQLSNPVLQNVKTNFVLNFSKTFVHEYTEEIVEELVPQYLHGALKELGASDGVADFVSSATEFFLATVNSADGINVNLSSSGLNIKKLGVSVDENGEFVMDSYESFVEGLKDVYGINMDDAEIYYDSYSGVASFYTLGMNQPLRIRRRKIQQGNAEIKDSVQPKEIVDEGTILIADELLDVGGNSVSENNNDEDFLKSEKLPESGVRSPVFQAPVLAQREDVVGTVALGPKKSSKNSLELDSPKVDSPKPPKIENDSSKVASQVETNDSKEKIDPRFNEFLKKFPNHVESIQDLYLEHGLLFLAVLNTFASLEMVNAGNIEVILKLLQGYSTENLFDQIDISNFENDLKLLSPERLQFFQNILIDNDLDFLKKIIIIQNLNFIINSSSNDFESFKTELEKLNSNDITLLLRFQGFFHIQSDKLLILIQEYTKFSELGLTEKFENALFYISMRNPSPQKFKTYLGLCEKIFSDTSIDENTQKLIFDNIDIYFSYKVENLDFIAFFDDFVKKTGNIGVEALQAVKVLYGKDPSKLEIFTKHIASLVENKRDFALTHLRDNPGFYSNEETSLDELSQFVETFNNPFLTLFMRDYPALINGKNINFLTQSFPIFASLIFNKDMSLIESLNKYSNEIGTDIEIFKSMSEILLRFGDRGLDFAVSLSKNGGVDLSKVLASESLSMILQDAVASGNQDILAQVVETSAIFNGDFNSYNLAYLSFVKVKEKFGKIGLDFFLLSLSGVTDIVGFQKQFDFYMDRGPSDVLELRRLNEQEFKDGFVYQIDSSRENNFINIGGDLYQVFSIDNVLYISAVKNNEYFSKSYELNSQETRILLPNAGNSLSIGETNEVFSQDPLKSVKLSDSEIQEKGFPPFEIVVTKKPDSAIVRYLPSSAPQSNYNEKNLKNLELKIGQSEYISMGNGELYLATYDGVNVNFKALKSSVMFISEKFKAHNDLAEKVFVKNGQLFRFVFGQFSDGRQIIKFENKKGNDLDVSMFSTDIMPANINPEKSEDVVRKNEMDERFGVEQKYQGEYLLPNEENIVDLKEGEKIFLTIDGTNDASLTNLSVQRKGETIVLKFKNNNSVEKKMTVKAGETIFLSKIFPEDFQIEGVDVKLSFNGESLSLNYNSNMVFGNEVVSQGHTIDKSWWRYVRLFSSQNDVDSYHESLLGAFYFLKAKRIERGGIKNKRLDLPSPEAQVLSGKNVVYLTKDKEFFVSLSDSKSSPLLRIVSEPDGLFLIDSNNEKKSVSSYILKDSEGRSIYFEFDPENNRVFITVEPGFSGSVRVAKENFYLMVHRYREAESFQYAEVFDFKENSVNKPTENVVSTQVTNAGSSLSKSVSGEDLLNAFATNPGLVSELIEKSRLEEPSKSESTNPGFVSEGLSEETRESDLEKKESLSEFVSKREEMAKLIKLFSRYADLDVLKYENSGMTEFEIVENIYSDITEILSEPLVLTPSQIQLVKQKIRSYRSVLLRAKSVKDSSLEDQRKFLSNELLSKYGVQIEGDISLLQSKTFEISMVFSLSDNDFDKIINSKDVRAFHVQTKNGLLVIVRESVAKGNKIALERTIIHEETHAINAFTEVSKETSDELSQLEKDLEQGNYESVLSGLSRLQLENSKDEVLANVFQSVNEPRGFEARKWLQSYIKTYESVFYSNIEKTLSIALGKGVDLSEKATEIALKEYREPLFEAVSALEKLLRSNVPNIKEIILLTPIEKWGDLLSHYSSIDPSLSLRASSLSSLSIDYGLRDFSVLSSDIPSSFESPFLMQTDDDKNSNGEVKGTYEKRLLDTVFITVDDLTNNSDVVAENVSSAVVEKRIKSIKKLLKPLKLGKDVVTTLMNKIDNVLKTYPKKAWDGFVSKFKTLIESTKKRIDNKIEAQNNPQKDTDLQPINTTLEQGQTSIDSEIPNLEVVSEKPSRELSENPSLDYLDVSRSFEVSAIGDLHGNYNIFMENLRGLSVIDSDGNWSYGNGRLVLNGDILADRNTSSFEIMLKINELKKQAKESGGEVIVLAGNHDDFAISYLANTPVAGGGSPLSYLINGQGLGLGEFLEFGSFEGQIKRGFEVPMALTNQRESIVQKMRNDERGRKILEEISSMQLITVIDDTLYLHTTPNNQIVTYIEKYGVQGLNEFYTAMTRYYLLGEGVEPSNSQKEMYDKLRKAFLYTDNRGRSNNELVLRLKKLGLNCIIHGHTGYDFLDKNTGLPIEEFSDLGFQIIDIDTSAGKAGENSSENLAILKTKKNGEIVLAGNVEGEGRSMVREGSRVLEERFSSNPKTSNRVLDILSEKYEERYKRENNHSNVNKNSSYETVLERRIGKKVSKNTETIPLSDLESENEIVVVLELSPTYNVEIRKIGNKLLISPPDASPFFIKQGERIFFGRDKDTLSASLKSDNELYYVVRGFVNFVSKVQCSLEFSHNGLVFNDDKSLNGTNVLVKKSENPTLSFFGSGLDKSKRQELSDISSLSNPEFLARQAKATRELFEFKDGLLKPKRKISIDGVSDNESFFVSDIITSVTNVGSNYDISILWYSDGNILVPRLLYQSRSDGTFRTTPGYSSVQGFNKGAHYSQSTKIHPNILEELSFLDSVESINNEEFRKVIAYFSAGNDDASDIRTYHEESKIYTGNETINTLGKGLNFGPYGGDTFSGASLTLEDSIKGYERFPKEFIPANFETPKTTYEFVHTMLGVCKVEVFSAQLDGREIEWHFASDSEGRVWIDRVVFADANYSSYGVPSEIINSFFLTIKPLNYKEHVAGLGDLAQEYSDGSLDYKYNYYDTTAFIDTFPVVKDYRRARAIYRTENDVSKVCEENRLRLEMPKITETEITSAKRAELMRRRDSYLSLYVDLDTLIDSNNIDSKEKFEQDAQALFAKMRDELQVLSNMDNNLGIIKMAEVRELIDLYIYLKHQYAEKILSLENQNSKVPENTPWDEFANSLNEEQRKMQMESDMRQELSGISSLTEGSVSKNPVSIDQYESTNNHLLALTSNLSSIIDRQLSLDNLEEFSSFEKLGEEYLASLRKILSDYSETFSSVDTSGNFDKYYRLYADLETRFKEKVENIKAKKESLIDNFEATNNRLLSISSSFSSLLNIDLSNVSAETLDNFSRFGEEHIAIIKKFLKNYSEKFSSVDKNGKFTEYNRLYVDLKARFRKKVEGAKKILESNLEKGNYVPESVEDGESMLSKQVLEAQKTLAQEVSALIDGMNLDVSGNSTGRSGSSEITRLMPAIQRNDLLAQTLFSDDEKSTMIEPIQDLIDLSELDFEKAPRQLLDFFRNIIQKTRTPEHFSFAGVKFSELLKMYQGDPKRFGLNPEDISGIEKNIQVLEDFELSIEKYLNTQLQRVYPYKARIIDYFSSYLDDGKVDLVNRSRKDINSALFKILGKLDGRISAIKDNNAMMFVVSKYSDLQEVANKLKALPENVAGVSSVSVTFDIPKLSEVTPDNYSFNQFKVSLTLETGDLIEVQVQMKEVFEFYNNGVSLDKTELLGIISLTEDEIAMIDPSSAVSGTDRLTVQGHRLYELIRSTSDLELKAKLSKLNNILSARAANQFVLRNKLPSGVNLLN